ncbi:hypothetical protein BDY19DRAFT_192223 [Irpex rosettiformis]|uniref:Uncharacterized protein n=1 Tax=Irpex rosettiformis TaxID=378272 RepID=A0ACB8U1U0_9APHY|nr:hypothetical protein BDY19DRAFT_192223 [Irpex rosettiformis]
MIFPERVVDDFFTAKNKAGQLPSRITSTQPMSTFLELAYIPPATHKINYTPPPLSQTPSFIFKAQVQKVHFPSTLTLSIKIPLFSFWSKHSHPVGVVDQRRRSGSLGRDKTPQSSKVPNLFNISLRGEKPLNETPMIKVRPPPPSKQATNLDICTPRPTVCA